MNVSRLSDFAAKLVALEAQFNSGKRLSRVAGKLNEMISQPQNPQFQTELIQQVGELRKGLVEVEQQLTPAMEEFLSELGGRMFFLPILADDIEDQIHTNAITPAAVKSYVDDYVARRSKFIESLRSLSTSLSALGLTPRPLEPGQAEIGFKIPREIFENRLIGFSGELKFIERVVERFSEAVTGDRVEAELSELSTTDPLVILVLAAPVVVAIGKTVTWFLESYKKTLEIKEIKARLKKMEVGDTRSLDERVEKIVSEAIEKRVQEVAAPRLDAGRHNEVENGLRLVMRELWARVERGMTVEIRFLPPPPKENPTEEEKRDEEAYSELQRIQKELVFPLVHGEPLLALPAADSDNPKPEKPRRTRKPRKDPNREA